MAKQISNQTVNKVMNEINEAAQEVGVILPSQVIIEISTDIATSTIFTKEGKRQALKLFIKGVEAGRLSNK